MLLINSNSARCDIIKCNQTLIDADLIQAILQKASVLKAKGEDIEGCNGLIGLARQLLGIYAEKPLKGITSKFTLGNIYLEMRKLSEAREFYNQAIDIFRMFGDRQGEGNALALIGDTFYYEDGFPQALEYYKQAQAIFLKTSAKYSEVTVLYQMLSSYSFMGEYARAIETTGQYLVVAKNLGLQSLEAHALHQQGIHYQAINAKTEAAKYYNKSWDIAREIGAGKLEIQNMRKLAKLYMDRFLIEEAIQTCHESLRMARQFRHRLEEAHCLQSLAEAYFYQGDLTRSNYYSKLSLKVKQEVGIALVEKPVNFLEINYFLLSC
ncbi:tetratricopeptide repeat protein [Scytonema sp. NUACC21]